MFNVACFCGCCYSFSDGAGLCPRCGRAAVVPISSTGPGSGRRQVRPETLVLTDATRTLVLTSVNTVVGECDAHRPGAGGEN
jgi:hypothetical protein